MNALLLDLQQQIARGQDEFRSTMQQLVRLVRPDLQHVLSATNPAALEPLAFLQFSAGAQGSGLDQAFAGYASSYHSRSFQVRSGAQGHIFIPQLGYFATPFANQWMTLTIGDISPSIEFQGAAYSCSFTPSVFIRGTTIELLRYPCAWLETAFAGQQCEPDAQIEDKHVDNLAKAFALLQQASPLLFETLTPLLRLIVVFRDSHSNSFATTAAHGAIFINSALGRDEIFFLEDLVHQGGHVLFAAATSDAASLFCIDPSTPLSAFHKDLGDSRSVYVALHGVFTEALIGFCLDAIAAHVTGRQRHELEGRLWFITRKLVSDRQLFLKYNILSPSGMQIFDAISATARQLVNKRGDLLRAANFSNQNYNFDYDSYLALNPDTSNLVPLNEISRIGFGCYRVSSTVPEHRRALSKALSLGCTLIDTASNYMDGRSEELVGEVLQDDSCPPVFVVTKLGYISPSTERFILLQGVSESRFNTLSQESKYSLAVDSLQAQFELSCLRLQRTRLDAVLLHNPEHVLIHDADGFIPSCKETLRQAFQFLEHCVAAGKLRYYGISSNSLPEDWPITLHGYLEAAHSVSPGHHFRILQFPCNFVENAAGEPADNGRTLIDEAKRFGLVTLANRPLNAQHRGEVFRFATYDAELAVLETEMPVQTYDRCVAMLRDRLEMLQTGHGIMEFGIMKFLRDNWRGVEQPDLVDEIFQRHFYPFVHQLFTEGIPPHVKEACSQLHYVVRLHAKRKLNERAHGIQDQLTGLGLIPNDSAQSLAELACRFALDKGIDHVLVGMRSEYYVGSLSRLIELPQLQEETVCHSSHAS